MARATGAPSLGRSLKLDAGDLVLTRDLRDLDVVEQLGALTQALELAIETQLGSDRMNSTFGFDRLAIGAYAYELHTRKEYVKMQLVRCISADRRVRDVREVFFQDDPRFFELRGLGPAAQQPVVAQARASREYTVYAIVETIAHDALSVEGGLTLG